MHHPAVIDEARTILSLLSRKLPTAIDGKSAILELKDVDYQWRQMEWIGWYFEYKIFTLLNDLLGGSEGPIYGNTQFDYKRDFVWDIKAHPLLKPNGKKNEPMILNDKEAVELCIKENSGIGFIIVNGYAQFDDTGKFKVWHDGLKGEISAYEIERISRGAKSRTRKIGFRIDSINAIFYNTIPELEKAINEGWMSFFQKGMRNADGSPRRAKYALWVERAPDSIKVTAPVRY